MDHMFEVKSGPHDMSINTHNFKIVVVDKNKKRTALTTED